MQTLQRLVNVKAPRNFIRGYLATIKIVLEGPETPAKQKLLEQME